MHGSKGVVTAVAVIMTSFLTTNLMAQTYSANTSTLVEQFGTRLQLKDGDSDGQLTDLDFIIFVIDRVFENETSDENCDGVLDNADAVISLARELSSLASDFNRNSVVEGTDVEHVFDNLGAQNVNARSGDVNGDSVVDTLDLLDTCDRIGQVVALDPVEAAYDILDMFLPLQPWMRTLELPGGDPCPPPDLCGSATCKAQCVDPTTGQKWTYRLFMIGFCGSQFEATSCCDEITPFACNCSTGGFGLSCWVEAQGLYVVCLLAIPD